MEWIKTKLKMPITFEKGWWDGKRSEVLVFVDSENNIYVGRLYEGCLDGEEFSDWITERDDYIIGNVKYWHPLPQTLT
jgi:hypothetical protein